MKQTLIFLLFPLLAHAQETTTFTVDTLGRHNVQLTTITTYQRPDSTVYETRSSVRFKNRGEAKKHINLLFAERIAADSSAIENARRHRAGLMASRQALLADLNRGNRNSDTQPAKKQVEAAKPSPEINPVAICWDGHNYIPCSQKQFIVGKGDTAYYERKWVADPPKKAFLVFEPQPPGYMPSPFTTLDSGFTVPVQLQLNPTIYPAEVPPAEQKLPTIKQAKPKKKKQ